MLEIEIRKPLYGNFVYIRAAILNQAIKRKEKVLVRIPAGSAIIDPFSWKVEAVKNSKVMKKVFKYADSPMLLFGGYVPIAEIKGEVEKPQDNEFKQLTI